MSDGATLKCPRASCGYVLKREEVEKFCPYCGEDVSALLAVSASEPQEGGAGVEPSPRVSAPKLAPSAVEAAAETVGRNVPAQACAVPPVRPLTFSLSPPDQDAPTSVDPQETPLSVTLKLEHPRSSTSSINAATAHGCPEVLVEYNHALIFLVGCKLNFEFHITPQVEGISNIRVEIRDTDKQQIIATQSLNVHLVKGQCENLPMAFRPEEQHEGELNCDITISYAWQGTRLVYRARRKTHSVLRATDSTSKVLETVNLNLTQNLDHAHANDFRISMDDLVGRLQQQRGQYRINFAEIKPPALWEPLQLSSVSSRPPAARALTLCLPMMRVHLLPDDQVRVGRSRENELVARIPGADKEANQHIHAFHCQILRVDSEVFIKDGGVYQDGFRPSSNGTFVNGEQLAPGGDYKLPPSKAVVLTLSDKDHTDKRVFGLRMRLWRRMDVQDGLVSVCGKGAPEEIVALTMQALRDPQQWFVLLWRQFPPDRICGHRWGGVCLCKEPLGFLLQQAGVCDPLEFGCELNIGGQALRVLRYEKPWISTVR